MSYTVYLSGEAELDLLEASSWYEIQRIGLGDEMQLCVEAKLNHIARNPNHFQVRYKTVQVAYTDRFPYGIHFLVDGNRILVQGIFHMSQSPKSWDNR